MTSIPGDEIGGGHGPRTGSDPSNSAQEIAVLRSELRSLEIRLTALYDSHKREHVMIKEAVDKAEQSVDKRLEAMNELRQQITNERSLYTPRTVFDANQRDKAALITANSDKLILLTSELSGLREDFGTLKSGQEWLVRLVTGTVVVAVITGLLTLLRTLPPA